MSTSTFSSYLFILFVGEEGGQSRVLGPGDGYQVGVFDITVKNRSKERKSLKCSIKFIL